MSLFYPDTNPANLQATSYRGRTPVVTVPWDLNTTFDVLPLMQFLVRTYPHYGAMVWAHG
jgi:hypothetical protein